MQPSRLLPIAAVWLMTATTVSGEEPQDSGVVITAIEIDLDSAGRETLRQLWVVIENSGEHHAGAFEFEVTIGDRSVPVYRNHSFLTMVAPRESRRLRLFNFWTSETGRPYPSSAELPVRVALRAASWWQEVEDEGETVWMHFGDFENPASVATLTLSAAQ